MSGEAYAEWCDRMKEALRTLVPFAKHDPNCGVGGGGDNKKINDEAPWGAPVQSGCTCGLRRVFDEIDELIDD